jgi:GAF domain-containing protein
MNQLREQGIRLLAAPTLQKAMEEALDASVAMLRAEMGMIHLYNPQSEELEIVAHRGCPDSVVNRFRLLKHDAAVARSMAMKECRRVVVKKLQADLTHAACWQAASEKHVRALQATPMLSRDGRLLGVLTTHFQ